VDPSGRVSVTVGLATVFVIGVEVTGGLTSGRTESAVPENPEGTHMAKATAELTTTASPEAVWTVVRDFHGLDTWMPGIDSLRSEGDDRILAMMGMEIRERLVAIDEDGRTITYTIVEGAPVESHEATITVIADGDGTRVTWDVEATPDEMAGLMQGIYQSSLEALATHVSG
jgi:carbon monoxide dehydrogenase subunit G